MIPENARDGSLLGITFDENHIPEKIVSDNWELSGDYIRVARAIHVEDEIARYDGPVVIIHGDDDETVPFSFAEKAGELYKNARVIPIHGDDHCFTRHLPEMAEAIRTFFEEEKSGGAE